jgi:hypothetical protein
MTRTQHFCDHCKEKILEERTLLTVVSGPLLPTRKEYEFCAGCVSLIEEWCRGGKELKETRK